MVANVASTIWQKVAYVKLQGNNDSMIVAKEEYLFEIHFELTCTRRP